MPVQTVQNSDFQPGFCGTHLPRVPQPASKNDLAREITPDSVVEILSIFFCFNPFLRVFFVTTYINK